MRRRVSHRIAVGVMILIGPWCSASRAETPPTPAPDQVTDSFAKDVVPFLSKHCFECHGNGKRKADLSLDQFRDEQAVLQDRDLWENLIDMVRAGEMPPKERSEARPTSEESEAALQAIEAMLARLDCGASRDAGRVTLRRLNRAEYNNTIRDLVGVDFKPAADFPEDDVGYGFDNIGDVLSLSPLLLEKYLTAAELILDQAIIIDDPLKPTKSRAVATRPTAPIGGTEGRDLFLNADASFRAKYDFDEGDYLVRLELFGKPEGGEPIRAALRVNFDDIREFEVSSDRSAPTVIEAKIPLKRGTRPIAVAFLNPSEAKGGDDPSAPRRRLYLRGITVEGPYNAPPPVLPESHRRIMAHRTGLAPREAAREILARFAAAAFRRPVVAEEVEKFLALYDLAEKEGDRFEDRIRLGLARILVSPHFLFRVELDPPDAQPETSYPVGEYELASRLSYFLWSSMPDAELFDLAAKGRLRQDLDTQVRRMLADPKSAAFVPNFAGQWLTIRKLDTVAPDRKTFPGFDEELRASMARETELFFEAIVREDRSILDLLDADFSFINERLAKHYGIAGVTGKEFRRVKLPPNRGGILTHASILTLTSNPTRTSPVKRGKWVLDQILNTPPPPPPPDVPDLSEQKQLTGTLRQVMEQHRANVLCSSCHRRMDPIGFAFENYDAIGAWREKDGPYPIDPSGALPDGQSFQGPAELKLLLKEKRDLFGRSLTEKLMTYALGRGLEYYDRCAVDEIVEALDRNDYRFSTLLAEVIKSEPFQMRTTAGAKP